MLKSIVENGNCIWRYRQGQREPMSFISLIYKVGEYKILDIDSKGNINKYTPEIYFFEPN